MKTNLLATLMCLVWVSACSKKEVREESSPQEIARFETLKRGVDSLDEKYGWREDARKGQDLEKTGNEEAIKQFEKELLSRPLGEYDEFVRQLGDPDQQLLSNGRGTASWSVKVKGSEEPKPLSPEYGNNSIFVEVKYKGNIVEHITIMTVDSHEGTNHSSSMQMHLLAARGLRSHSSTSTTLRK